MFEGEALGLEAMYETRTIRVPKPHKASLIFLFLWRRYIISLLNSLIIDSCL